MRSRTWARHAGVLVLGLLTLPAPLLATTADDLCASSANPCVVATPVVVDDGSTIDLGARTLHIVAGGSLDVGSGGMTLRAATLTIDAGGFARALGSASTAGGTVTIEVDQATIAGTVDASGTPGGTVTVTATGTLSATGTVSARALSRVDLGGTVNLTAASATVSGPVSAVGGPDATGGDINVTTSGDLMLNSVLDASGGDPGGCIEVQAGSATSGGNITLGAAAVLRADATTAGGSGGEVDVTAQGDGTTTGNANLDGLLSAKALAGSPDIGGGSGGCVSVTADGDVRMSSDGADLTADGGAPDGDAGEVDITSQQGVVVQLGTVSASVAGADGAGGTVMIESNGDATIGGSVLVNAADSSAAEVDVTSDSAGISIAKSGVVDASSTSAAGGAICLDSGSGPDGAHSIVIDGQLVADGGAAGGAGGVIDLEGGDSVHVSATGVVHAAGGSAGGAGGMLIANVDPGNALIEGPLTATGGLPNGMGGSIAIDAVGPVSLSAMLDVHGPGAGGQVTITAEAGAIDAFSNITAASTAAAGGSIGLTAQGDVRIAGTLTSDGATAPGGRIDVVGCKVTVCGLDSPVCPAGGTGVLSSLGPSGMNRVTGRDSSAILGKLRANQSNGHNDLVYDGDPDREPFVRGTVAPPAELVVDSTVLPCPVCGDKIVEPPETCDDGNQTDGDGCSASCQIEAPKPGDANGDSVVSLDDVRFEIAEIFDGDGDSITMVSGGGFRGAPGADANGDQLITAADLTATLKLLAPP